MNISRRANRFYDNMLIPVDSNNCYVNDHLEVGADNNGVLFKQSRVKFQEVHKGKFSKIHFSLLSFWPVVYERGEFEKVCSLRLKQRGPTHIHLPTGITFSITTKELSSCIFYICMHAFSYSKV